MHAGEAGDADPLRRLIRRLGHAGARRAATGLWTGQAAFDQALAVLRVDHDVDFDVDAEGSDDPDHADDSDAVVADAALAESFGLDRTDLDLLWSAAAPSLDASIAIALAQLRGTTGTSQLNVALACELAGLSTATPEPFVRLGPGGALVRHRLVTVTDAEPWLTREVRVPLPVLARLAGGWLADPEVERMRVDLVALHLDAGETVARAIVHDVPLVWIHSAHAGAGSAVAADGFARVGRPMLSLDLRRLPAGRPVAELMATAARDAGLRGAGLVLVGGEELTALDDATAALGELQRAAVPVVAVSTQPWNPRWTARLPLLVEGGALSPGDRAHVWRRGLGAVADDTELAETLLGLRLSGEDIRETTRYAEVLADVRDQTLDGGLIREAARRVSGSGGAGASRLHGRTAGRALDFDDLVLPDHVMGSLKRFTSWARHRDSLRTDAGLRGRGRGISALFTGNPGTGKTLAAHVIADELAIELFQVDLSTVVDKYIGETEKNLERVFAAAEALDVVLFFDEADALFGRRSGVSDARDRYANQEVAYLLQRMEHFDGITILSTNLRGNLDRAFARRLSFIVNFPDPDVATRVRLWQHHLDQLEDTDPADPVDVHALASAVDLAGGDVRNIVLAAAYDAAGEGAPVGHRHAVAATRREFTKLGRVVPTLVG